MKVAWVGCEKGHQFGVRLTATNPDPWTFSSGFTRTPSFCPYDRSRMKLLREVSA